MGNIIGNLEWGDPYVDPIDLQLQSLNGEDAVLKIPRRTLGREVHKMALELLPSKPGACNNDQFVTAGLY
eukprot:Skav206896  [mRNA]  locus=scaffold2387:308838:309047:+ [translate_table: standard]